MSPKSLGLCAALLAVLATSCSAPTAPPARAGATFSIAGVSPAVAGKACNTTGRTFHLPDQPLTSPSVSNVGDTITDGKDGAEVTCRVRQNGDSFEVTGSARLAATAMSANFTLDSSGAGTGGLNLVTEFGNEQSDSANPCTFTSLQVKSGAVWASFSCPVIYDRSSPDSTYCSSDGVVALQDCKH